jgi:hypothetical protein
MKTAMQELIEYVDSIWSNGGWEQTIKEKAKELLKKEKEQIRYAYEQGENDYECREEERYDKESLSEQYYNQTYNQNK